MPKRPGLVAPIVAFTVAILILFGAVSYLINTESHITQRVTRLEVFNKTNDVCALHEKAQCQKAISGFITSLTVPEREQLASSLSPYIPVKVKTVVIRQPAIRGPQGAPGARGPKGARGPSGQTGAQGPKGGSGQGSRGPRGLTGATGPAGPMGPQGPLAPLSPLITYLCTELHLPCS
jgi:hypothetical protein